jgi:hypothetical protein
MQQAWAQVQAALIRVGGVLAPIVADLASLVGVVGDLPDGVLTAAAVLGLLAAALGPVLSISGRVVSGLAGLSTALGNAVLPAGALSGAFDQTASASTSAAGGIAGVAGKVSVLLPLAAAAAIALDAYNKTKQEAARLTGLYSEALAREADAQEAATDAVSAAELTAGHLGSKLRDAGADLEVFNQAIRGSGREIEDLDDHLDVIREFGLSKALDEGWISSTRLTDELMRLNGEMSRGEMADLIDRLDGLSDRYDDATEAAANTEFAERELAGQHGETAAQVAGVEEAYTEATTALQEYLDQLRAQFDPLFAMQDALVGAADAQAAVTEAQGKLNEALDGGNADTIAEAQRNYDDALRGAQGALFDVQAAQITLNDAIAKGDVTVGDAQQQLYDWAIQAGYTEDQARQMADGFGSAAFQAAVLGAQDPNVAVTTTGVPQTAEDLNALKAKVDAVPREIRIVARVDTILMGSNNVPVGRAAGGPIDPFEIYRVGEHGPEWFVSDKGGHILPNGQNPVLVPSSAYPAAAPAMASASGGGGTVIENLNLRTIDPPRRWLDEASWRTASP